MGRCAWCEAPLAGLRRDARFCGVRCRQAAHRFGRGAEAVVAGSRRDGSGAVDVRRFGYADPPYPGKAHMYRDHPDFGGEVDHRVLIERLVGEFPDGWALSTSAKALQDVLSWCPRTVRVMPWLRGERAARSWGPLSSWEPVIVAGGRPVMREPADRVIDSLVAGVSPRLTDPARVIGAKPSDFCYWLFQVLGAMPGDEVVDLFPGSGGVGRAWAEVNRRAGPGDGSGQVLGDGFGDVVADA